MIFNLALIGQNVLEEKRFKYYGEMHVHVYLPGVGADKAMGYNFSESFIFSPAAHFLQDFSFKRHLIVFGFKCIGNLC